MTINIFNKGYVTDELSNLKACEANLNEENRIKWVTDLAAISRGKSESNNPKKRYEMLLKEAALGTPSRPIEFIPVVLKITFGDGIYTLSSLKDEFIHEFISLHEINKLLRYSYLEYSGDIICYTNMRAMLNAGVPYDKVPYNTKSELINFKVAKIKAPMFVFNHLVTHTQLSKEARSERVVSLNTSDYWLPVDFYDNLYKISNNDNFGNIARKLLTFDNVDAIINSLLKDYSQVEVQNLFKEMGYKKEIYQRAMLEFRYKEFIMVGWYNNSHAWKHLFIERNTEQDKWRNWTQNETEVTVKAIKRIVENV